MLKSTTPFNNITTLLKLAAGPQPPEAPSTAFCNNRIKGNNSINNSKMQTGMRVT